jgi:hypothetical protein
MVEIVAVECPPTRIVGVEGDTNPSTFGHDQHGIAHGALDRAALLTLLIGAGLGSTMPAAQTMVQWAAGVERLGL